MERLLSLCRIVLVDRPGYSVDLDTLYAQLPAARERILRVAGPALTISASELRARLAEDPWSGDLLVVCDIQPWTLWLPDTGSATG